MRIKPSIDVKHLSTIFEPPDIASKGLVVSDDEVDFFKTNGFLFKRNLLDKSACQAAMNSVWRSLERVLRDQNDPDWRIDRNSPQGWRDVQLANTGAADASGFFEGRQRTAIHGRTVKMHEIGNADYLLKLLPNNQNVRAVANAMLGEPLKRTYRTRGVYAILPGPVLTEEEKRIHTTGERLGPHTDRVCQQLNVCAYLEDVPSRSGGFTVYPGSHKHVFYGHRYESNWSPTKEYNDVVASVVNTTTPVEFVGDQGDVVFWHGRMVHSAGIHVGPSIRWAMFADFTLDQPTLDADGHRSVGQYEWFKDAKLFRSDRVVTQDMWRGWRIH